jgi:DNA polymerase I-like protein with 3'-5' exonuclease and polymerase domains
MAKRIELPDVIDFETMPIRSWPDYPPKPVGVSILLAGQKKAKYYAWGHKAGGNNCTFEDAKSALQAVWKGKQAILCHNGKFDLDIAETYCGCPLPNWERLHDTMFLIFLADPHSPNLKLKPAAERLLGMLPEEQDAVRDWCISQKLITKAVKEFGEFIWMAPGDLVGKYANGDTSRTLALFLKLYPEVLERGMEAAYNRERRLLPVLLRNEHQGVPVDYKLMKADDAKYEAAQGMIDAWLCKTLKVPKGFNLDSDVQLADAMIACGKADADLFMTTATGKRSVAKDSLIGAVTDLKLLQALQYRARLGTAHGTFLHPWFLEATGCGGLVHPSWNQVRQAGHGKDTAGARSGRLSASRFMNVPKEFKERETGKNAYKHPSHIKNLPELPFMRNYMQPFKGEVWCKRDYMQQELRILAHFGDGELMRQFREDPTLDVHDLAAELITQQFGIPVTRDDTKTMGFGLIYGMGLGSLAERLGVDVNAAKTVKDAYMSIFPELKAIDVGLRDYAKLGEPLTTWGGRQYFCEPPAYSEKYKRMQTFEYKMLNYLIQPSAADCTKEALIRYDEAKVHGRFLLTVHDEINISVAPKHVKSEMQLLREVMASVDFDVPMLSDGGTGKNWGTLAKYKETPLVLAPWQ